GWSRCWPTALPASASQEYSAGITVTRASLPCAVHGCPNLKPCPDHIAADAPARATAAQRGYGAAWRRIAAHYLARFPWAEAQGANAAFTGQKAVSWTSGGATVELVQGVVKSLTAQQYTDMPQAVKDACTLIDQPATNPGDAAALTSAQVATADGSDAGTTQ